MASQAGWAVLVIEFRACLEVDASGVSGTEGYVLATGTAKQ